MTIDRRSFSPGDGSQVSPGPGAGAPGFAAVDRAFLITGTGSLLGGMGWLALHPGLLESHFYRPGLFGLTHVLTLGWISTMVLGVLRRLSPMLCGVPVPGRGVSWTLYATWVIGVSGMVSHMWRSEWFGVWTAAGLLWVTIALFAVVHRGLFLRARGGDWVARYAAAGIVHFVLAAGLGVLVALNKHQVWFTADPYRFAAAHFHLAEAGWVTWMILGFGRKLWPPLAPDRGAGPAEDHLRFWSLEAGLLALVAGLLGAGRLVAPASVLLVLALLLHFRRPLARLAAGRIRDRASLWAAVAVGLGTAACVTGGALGLGLTQDPRVVTAHGFLTLVGWNGVAITAFALKLIPMWVREERHREAAPEPGTVPAIRDLVSRPLQEATGALLAGGTVVTVAGILLAQGALIRTGVWMVFGGCTVFALHLGRILFRRAAPPPR